MDPNCPDPKSDDFESWLAEVELANEAIRKLNSGEMTIEEFDKREKRREAWKERENQEQLRKITEKEERIRMGRPGKGNSKDYKTFCRYCFTEYEIIVPKCNRCGNSTITAEERLNELKGKVEQYKEDKSRKIERKHKWDMWQKTKASLWKKTSTNYSKWEYFTSSEDEENDENKDPILPKNDPSFQALERDLEQRSMRKKRDMAKAEELKLKGNEFLKTNEYKKAIDKYSEAIELVKDYKALYTNRALAYIKLGKFNKAIEDCSKMLEYCEVFEKGYERSKDTCLKALMRRAHCFKEKLDFDSAGKDLDEAEKISPNNKELQELRKSLDLAKIHKEMAKEIGKEGQEQKNIKNIEKIELFMRKDQPKSEEIDEICKILAKNSTLKVYFFEKKGLEKCLKMIQEDMNCFLLLNIELQENTYYQDIFLKFKGLELLINKVESLFNKALENSKLFDILEELFEVLVMLSQTDKIRNLMKEDQKVLKIYEDLFLKFLDKFENERESLTSLISFLSNMCYSSGVSLIKAKILAEIPVFLEKVKVLYSDTNRHSDPVKESLSNFIVNLLTEEKIRIPLSQNQEFLQILLKNLQKINIKKNNKFIANLQGLLGVFSNLCFQATDKALDIMQEFQLAKNLERFLEGGLNQEFETYKEIYLRSLNILSKLSYNPKDFNTEFFQRNFMSERFFNEKSINQGYTNHILRLLSRVLDIKELKGLLQEKCKPEKALIEKLIAIIKDDNEQRFCNACIVIGSLGEIFGGLETFKEIIERLIEVVKEKANLMRKNAAILLAKLSKDEGNLEKIRALHGIELLTNVSNIILKK